MNPILTNEIDKCVKCGLCLTSCPTFKLSHNENQSPRGRISLIQGLNCGTLEATESLVSNLDQCLQCLACENICPANINYSQLIKQTRDSLKEHPSFKKSPIILRFIVGCSSKVWQKAAFLLWLYQASGIRRLMQRLAFLRLKTLSQLDQLLPNRLNKPIQLKSYYPAQTHYKGKVALHTGCINSLVEQNVALSAVKVLTYFGYSVQIPKKQYCCGALAELNSGHKAGQSQFKKHFQSMQSDKIEAIITLNSGCLAHIKQQQNHPEHKETSALIHQDIINFINQQTLPEGIIINALNKRVTIQTPCSQKNALKQGSEASKLLQQIPGLIQVIIEDEPACCGGAADYPLKYPTISQQLAKEYLLKIVNKKPDIIVSNNIGCYLQLLTEIDNNNTKLQINHPITLYAKQISLKNKRTQ